ncbi:MAG: RNA polymerase sigma factor [Desulfomonile tiedjei]|nr:RNA polymerase sigma factor [Desulfomonile tiedjei]
MIDPDNELVRQARLGSQDAWTQLYERYRRPLASMVYSILRDYWESEDLVQDTFVKAFCNLSTFNGDSAFSTWLIRIALNTAQNRYQYLHTRGHYADLPERDERACESNIEDTYISDETVGIVEDLFNDFDPERAEILRLRFIQEHGYEEIASTLNMPLGTVKTHLHRSKKVLCERLQVLGLHC